jgi:hypothetical protein
VIINARGNAFSIITVDSIPLTETPTANNNNQGYIHEF